MKHQALFSSTDKLQFLFGALRVKLNIYDMHFFSKINVYSFSDTVRELVVVVCVYLGGGGRGNSLGLLIPVALLQPEILLYKLRDRKLHAQVL